MTGLLRAASAQITRSARGRFQERMQRLSPQSFSASTLDRSVDKRAANALGTALAGANAQLVLVQGRDIYVSGGLTPELLYVPAAALSRLGLTVRESIVEALGDGAQLPAYLLGSEHEGGGFVLVLDLGGGGPVVERIVPLLKEEGAEAKDLRQLLAYLPPTQLGVAGQAVALGQWHNAHSFCSRCGAPSHPVEAGSKRACSADPRHREYPRTDPVVIMLVESANGSMALLGRPRTLNGRGPMLTCLSGFVEQGESLEDAVRREVREEAGIEVGTVNILGSQPWPLGRGGSCELMIGCAGKALGDTLHIDTREMEEVRWVSRADVAIAVEAAKKPRDIFKPYSGLPPDSPVPFFIPPPYAIAHSLIQRWSANGPFFPARL